MDIDKVKVGTRIKWYYPAMDRVYYGVMAPQESETPKGMVNAWDELGRPWTVPVTHIDLLN